MKSLKTLCILPLSLLSFPVAAQETLMVGPEASIEALKGAKPYVLEVRYGQTESSGPAANMAEIMAQGSVAVDALAPTAEFLAKAQVLRVGVAREDKGFVSADQLLFGYSITPERNPGWFSVEYANQYGSGETYSLSRGSTVLKLGEWAVLSRIYNQQHHAGGQQAHDFQVAVRLRESVNN